MILLSKSFLAQLAATLEITAKVLCAEASYSEPETRAVMQVILNRRDSSIFPDSILGVVTQRGQFAKPTRCKKGWLRPHHMMVALQGISGADLLSDLPPHYDWLDRDALFFINDKAFRKFGDRWLRSKSLVGVSRRPNGKVLHYYLRLKRR